MKYMIATGKSEYVLTEAVNKLIENGWRPQGGVISINEGFMYERWAQAMVKE